MNKGFDFRTKVYNMTLGKNIDDAIDALQSIATTKYVDEGYDEAIDDEECEDRYIMYVSYDVTPKGSTESYHIVFYFGDISGKVSDIR